MQNLGHIVYLNSTFVHFHSVVSTESKPLKLVNTTAGYKFLYFVCYGNLWNARNV